MIAGETSFYVTGGTLEPNAPSYVERKADSELFHALQRGEFCYVLTSRQMGKSSLMARTAARLREEGAAVVLLELTALGQNLSVEQWYDGLLGTIGQQLELEEELEAFWLEHKRLSPLQRWLRALREVVLPAVGARRSTLDAQRSTETDETVPSAERREWSLAVERRASSVERLVICLDEIDTVRSLRFSTDEFFAAIRECYNRRSEDPAFHRLTFCLLGVAAPSDLIQDTRTTPFNIGRRIELSDFTEAEAAPLALGLGRWALGVGEPGNNIPGSIPNTQGPTPNAQRLLERILYWTGGHPYLTQRLCRAVAEAQSVTPSPFHPFTPSAAVDRLCGELFLSHGARERDDNLLFVRERLLKSEVDRASLLDLYSKVRAGKRVAPDETNPLVEILRLSGITRVADARRSTLDARRPRRDNRRPWGLGRASSVERRASLVVRNQIYARVFDRAWVAANMPDAELRRQRAAFRKGLLRSGAVACAVVGVVGALALSAVRERDRGPPSALCGGYECGAAGRE